MRAKDGEFVSVRAEEEEREHREFLADIEGLCESDEPTKKEKEYLKENVYLIKSTLKNKENMKRLIKSLAVPWDFARLLIVSATVALVCMGMIIAVYVMFVLLFNRLTEEISMVYYQLSLHRSVMEACSLSLQMVSVNR